MEAFVGLGTNLGDRWTNLQTARAALAALPGTQVVAASTIWESRPWGLEAQPLFFNQVIQLATDLSLEEFWQHLQRVEREMGRPATLRPRWGPRIIDLDLLLYGQVIIQRAELVVPHPRMLERDFVLVPLAELAPARRIPTTGLTVEEHVGQLTRQSSRLLRPVGKERE